MIDLIKALVLAGGYFIIAPIGGYILSKDRRMEDFSVYLLMFLLGLHIDTTVLMLGSIEWYRGTIKGYEFTMMEVLAVSLIFSTLFNSKRKFVFLPLGTILWFLYIGASSLSIFSALNVNYVFMSILKYTKVWLLVWAVCNYVRSRREVHILLTGLSIMLIYQFLVVSKMKWIDGFYQVRGLFEHQNPLAMFTYMAALPILAAAMSPATSKLRGLLYVMTFACSSIIVLASLSRAALAVFAVGTIAVIAAGFFDRFSGRRILTVALLSLGGAFVLAMTLDTIISRFNDEGNEASGETREVMNLAAGAMLEANPLGVGWNNFGKAINHPYPYGDVIDDWNRERGQKVDHDYAKGVVESHYWLLKAETGWLGYLTYMLFILIIALRTIPLILKRRGSLEASLALGILVAFGITYLHSHFERVLTQTKNLALWMTYIGLLGALVRLAAHRPKRRKELDRMKNPILILIAGPSGSGKSTLAQGLVSFLKQSGHTSTTALALDNYYRDIRNLTLKERDQHNFDHMDAWEHELIIAHAKKLKMGETIKIPLYDFNTHLRQQTTRTIAPHDIYVCEGLFALCYPQLNALANLKIYVEIDDRTALRRRIERDTRERGRSRESVIDQFENTVRLANRNHINPSAENAELKLSGTSPLHEQLEKIQPELKFLRFS